MGTTENNGYPFGYYQIFPYNNTTTTNANSANYREVEEATMAAVEDLVTVVVEEVVKEIKGIDHA